MFIALTGLHRAGKSHFLKNVPHKYGFTVLDKKQLLAYICKIETGRDDYAVWYAEEFNRDPYAMVKKMVDYIPTDQNIVLDAVHSNVEWYILKELVPNAKLMLVTALKEDRQERWDRVETEDLDKKDAKRIGFWHSDNPNLPCLLTDVSWTINGSGSIELIDLSFKELVGRMMELEEKPKILKRGKKNG